MKTINRKQRRETLRLRIIEHYGTQGRFAYKTGVDEAVLSKMVNCIRDPSEDQIELLCKLLETEADVLFKKV